MLYTASELNGAVAEAWFHAARGQPISPPKPMKRVHRLDAKLTRVLDLSSAGRVAAIGVDMRSYVQLSDLQRGGEYPTSQQIGEAAFFDEYQAVVVPNARWPTSNVVILTEHITAEQVTANLGDAVDLMSWRAANRLDALLPPT